MHPSLVSPDEDTAFYILTVSCTVSLNFKVDGMNHMSMLKPGR